MVVVTVVAAELACEITTPLVDVETQENETVSLVLVISKPRKVTWLKNGQDVAASGDRFQTSVSEDGLRHVLTMKDVIKDDTAQFTATVDDLNHGVITSSCHVTVVGTSPPLSLLLHLHHHHHHHHLHHYIWKSLLHQNENPA